MTLQIIGAVLDQLRSSFAKSTLPFRTAKPEVLACCESLMSPERTTSIRSPCLPRSKSLRYSRKLCLQPRSGKPTRRAQLHRRDSYRGQRSACRVQRQSVEGYALCDVFRRTHPNPHTPHHPSLAPLALHADLRDQSTCEYRKQQNNLRWRRRESNFAMAFRKHEAIRDLPTQPRECH